MPSLKRPRAVLTARTIRVLLLPGFACTGALGLSFLAPLPLAGSCGAQGAIATLPRSGSAAKIAGLCPRAVALLPLSAASGDEGKMGEIVEEMPTPLRPSSAASLSPSEPKPTAGLWNVPNALTMARVAAIPAFGAVFYISPEAMPLRNVVCAGIFALAAATDWLDGYIARRQNIVSPFGAFLDPVADKLMVATALILLSERLGSWMAVCTAAILCREIGVSALREWMAQIGARDTVKVGMAGKVKTAATMVALTLLLLLQPGPGCATILPRAVWLPAAQALLGFSTILTVTSGSGYLRAAWPSLLGKGPTKTN